MDIVSLLVALVIIGLILWLVSFIPMDPRIKQIIIGIAVAFIVIWLIYSLAPLISLHPHPLVR